VLTSHLLARDIDKVVEDSSGNAGASLAAYAARAGIDARIFVPSSATGPKRRQIDGYGAEIVPVPGPRSEAAEAVLAEVKAGTVYASHAYLPQGTAGIATIAYELVDQLGSAPGTVIMPVGHGSLLLGVAQGFDSLFAAGIISSTPKLIGVQAAACAPLFHAFNAGDKAPPITPEGSTIASGVAICDPYHGRYVLSAVRKSAGWFLAVAEEKILSGQELLASMGMYVEFTSGLVHDGLIQSIDKVVDPVICIISGHGLKNS
jgi:threonine synthase